MPRLFTYTIPFDDGAAPNPFNGMCTLAICKPVIRRVAKIGDWVAGFGSTDAPSGNLSGHLVYAMRVEEVTTLSEYDRRAPIEWPHRIPNISSKAVQGRLGDCIYDYSGLRPNQRPSVHDIGNMPTDLSGENVLISRDFYYFGRQAIPLDPRLAPILHQTQGHKSTCNAPHFTDFVTWIREVAPHNGQIGWPDSVVGWSGLNTCGGCAIRKADDEVDFEYLPD